MNKCELKHESRGHPVVTSARLAHTDNVLEYFLGVSWHAIAEQRDLLFEIQKCSRMQICELCHDRRFRHLFAESSRKNIHSWVFQLILQSTCGTAWSLVWNSRWLKPTTTKFSNLVTLAPFGMFQSGAIVASWIPSTSNGLWKFRVLVFLTWSAHQIALFSRV